MIHGLMLGSMFPCRSSFLEGVWLGDGWFNLCTLITTSPSPRVQSDSGEAALTSHHPHTLPHIIYKKDTENIKQRLFSPNKLCDGLVMEPESVLILQIIMSISLNKIKQFCHWT